MKTKLLALLLALALCLTLAACGAPAPTDAADDPTPAGEGDPVEPGDSDLAYVTDKGTLIIGYTVFPPMNYTDAEGNFTGFDTELAQIICEKLGVEPDFVVIDWSFKEFELQSKQIDVIWNGLTINEERKKDMDFTVPYLQNAQVLVMREDAEYTDTSSLLDKTVVAEMGSAGEKTVQEDENLSQTDYIPLGKQTDCLMEVAGGTSHAAVIDRTLAKSATGPGTDFSGLAIKDELSVEFYGIGFRLGSDITTAVNAILAELKADGTLDSLAAKYNLELA